MAVEFEIYRLSNVTNRLLRSTIDGRNLRDLSIEKYDETFIVLHYIWP